MKKPLFSRIGASSFVSSLFASQTIDRAFVALSVIRSDARLALDRADR